ncbi:MFS transporter [Streptosporangium saharense]|nr:MFS transporter [Streptosporangium saharense]
MGFLPESRDFRRFWGARVASFGGDQVAHVALVVLCAPHGTGAVSLMLLALSLPRLAGPLAGALADTLDAKKIMILADAGQAVTFLLAAVLPFGLATHLPLVAVATALNTIFLPAGRSSIPRMVRPEDLPRAFAAMAVCFNVGYAAGPLVGGVLVALVDPRVALGLNASTFAVSILLVTGLDLPPAEHGDRSGTGYWTTLRTRLTQVVRDPGVLAVGFVTGLLLRRGRTTLHRKGSEKMRTVG